VNGRIEESLCRFGVQAPDQLRRVLEVGEEDSDLLALAFEGRFGGEDLLSQVARGIGQRCMRTWVGISARATDMGIWDGVSVLQAAPGVK
jgi:hypothetical protein